MAQPSVACFFNSRKRTAVDGAKINHAKKVLVLDSNQLNDHHNTEGLESVKKIILKQNIESKYVGTSNISDNKPQEVEEKIFQANKIVSTKNANMKTASKKAIHTTRSKKIKDVANNRDIQELINNLNKKETIMQEHTKQTITECNEDITEAKHVTPPITPSKKINAMDKVKEKPDGPSIKEIRKKLSRSARLSELKASISRFQEGANKLKEVEKKTSKISESPKLKCFKTIELEIESSPKKLFSPEKAYLSPKKDAGARRNLIYLLSPTKNAVPALPQSPSKHILEETSKPALTLPFKYRYLAEMFRSIDTVVQILYNRKETITFRKLKPAVEQMLKRNMSEKHLAQIKNVYPEAFSFEQEKLKVFGSGMKTEQWELVIKPHFNEEHNMSSDVLLERRRKLFNTLLDKVKDYHHEFLITLDTPMHIPKEKITRWHPEFDIERVPDIDMAEIPQPPIEETFTTGKDVLEKARLMFNCNTRMEQALQRLSEARENNTVPAEVDTQKSMSTSVLKGIPKALLEKVRQKQAAKALVSMTRSADKEKEVQLYSRLPELARLTRNLFVSEKRNVLALDVVIEKLGNCYRGNLTKTEMEDHLKVISKEVNGWLVFHDIRKCMYIKLAKNADLSLVINKLENLVKQKSEK